MSKKINQSWGGRFNEPTNEFVKHFNASIKFDKILAPFDIQGSIAHAQMLSEQGIIEKAEFNQIKDGLEKILDMINSGNFEWSIDLEDVHMNIEAKLIDIIGETGKKLHTGRSRNDQVATDIRLYLRHEIIEIKKQINQFLTVLLDLAEREVETIMPGFTHLQVAQPISFAHHMMAYFEMLKRDLDRLTDAYKRVNTLPLGSAALAGTTYPINRERVAELLNFDALCQNSLDAVSDRDFVVEFLSIASTLMMHLSRMSEELIIWNSAQFGFVELPDSFCTGSSIMPQKKNPDMPELIRGKTGRVYGSLLNILTVMKGQPLAYNKDNQEDKEPLFDTVSTVRSSLRIFVEMFPLIKTNQSVMLDSALKGYSTATDLADYLVKKGLPFRDAHEVVGKTVAFAISSGQDISELSLSDLQTFSKLIEEDIFDSISLEGSLSARNHIGGTSKAQIIKAIKIAKNSLSK
ncbi:MAG: argininosuccinate lyase [Gammaproteobacteria bacterium]|nr:argininosuccinate lyase [Gammaproteobacteria bacterium]